MVAEKVDENVENIAAVKVKIILFHSSHGYMNGLNEGF